MVIASYIAVGVLLLALLGEWLHARRIRAVAFLAFGRGGRPPAWTRLTPLARAIGLPMVVWGAIALLTYRPTDGSPVMASARYSKQVLICLDVSPSMSIRDAGPDLPKQTRAEWAAKIVRPVLDEIDTSVDTRITLVAFYTSGIPVIADTWDKNVVANMLDGMSLSTAFKPGSTDLVAGVNAALERARPWAAHSTTLLVLSDGDSDAKASFLSRVPRSIAQSIVLGVGDRSVASRVSDRRSRQDAESLRSLAMRLGGEYIDCNRSAVPVSLASHLSMTTPASPIAAYQRTLGLGSVAVGSLLFAAVQPLLLRFGRPADRPPQVVSGLINGRVRLPA